MHNFNVTTVHLNNKTQVPKTEPTLKPPTALANCHAIKRGPFQLSDKRLYTTVS